MRARLRWSLIGAGLALLSAPALLAQDTTDDTAVEATVSDPDTLSAPAQTAAESQAELRRIEQSLTLSRERVETLRKEMDALQGDRDRQNAALIAAGQRVKLAEIEVGEMEERLNALLISEFEIRGRLEGADAEIANVLAALERISRHPPPALIVDPSDALGSARSALLISAILPQLQSRAAEVTADLDALGRIKAEALHEEGLLRANFAILEEEQLRIATLIAAQKQGEQVMEAELVAGEEENRELAGRAASLKQLIGVLEQRASALTAPPAAMPASPADLDAREAIELAYADTARTAPPLPFDRAKGHLSLPANGVGVLDYGSADGFGGTSSGLSIVTRAEARVVAPIDGWVLYSGPYLNYGQIVILNPGDGYTILLAGLAGTTVETGQFVQRGAPIGTMGSRTIGRTVTTSAGVSRPTLYIELRKDNLPINPQGWWAANQTQSG